MPKSARVPRGPIPEPFWVRHWFRWKPACYPCSMRRGVEVSFKDRDKWEMHWLSVHSDQAAIPVPEPSDE